MFAYCCGHATIVARRQPLFGLIESHSVARLEFRESEPPVGHNLSAIERETSPRTRLASSRDQPICRHAPPRIAKRNSNHIPAAADRSIALHAVRAAKFTPPDIARVRSDRVIFVRPALFARVFVAMKLPAKRAPTADLSFIRKKEQRRAQFVADAFDCCRN
jgi:hypothetical protein